MAIKRRRRRLLFELARDGCQVLGVNEALSIHILLPSSAHKRRDGGETSFSYKYPLQLQTQETLSALKRERVRATMDKKSAAALTHRIGSRAAQSLQKRARVCVLYYTHSILIVSIHFYAQTE